jgi:hypothetical protein
MKSRGAWLLAASIVAVASIAACGARSALDVGVSEGRGGAGGSGPTPPDAGPDVVHVEDCVEAAQLYVWTISQGGRLFRFDPGMRQFEDFGSISCSGNPNSMAVDRAGKAYVADNSGHLNEISVASNPGGGGGLMVPTSNPCSPTGFKVDQLGFKTFGMAYATDGDGPAEALYVAQADYAHPSKGLAKIDTKTFELEFIAPFSEDLGDAIELTGTGDGRLFGIFLANPGPGAQIAEIDKTNGQILSEQMVPVGTSTSNLAMAFWGGDFYIFTQNGDNPTFVTRYDPTTGFATMWATLPNEAIVGAGVSTCAPR